jgi:hypothetical protein
MSPNSSEYSVLTCKTEINHTVLPHEAFEDETMHPSVFHFIRIQQTLTTITTLLSTLLVHRDAHVPRL